MDFPRLKTSPATERDVGWRTQTDFIMWVFKLIQLFGAEALTFCWLKGWIKCIHSINIYWPFSRCQALGQAPKTDWVLQPQGFLGASRGDDQVEGKQWGYISVFHVPGKVQLFLTETPILFILCLEMLPYRRESPPPPTPHRSPECSCIYKCITHTAIHCYALNPPRETAFNILRCLELEQYLWKPWKNTCIIICGERKKLHLQRDASLVVSRPTGWGTWGTQMVWSRCSPLDHILSTQHLRIPHLSGSEPLPAPARAFPSLRKAIGLSLYAGEYTSAYKKPSKYGMAVEEEKVAGPLRC